MAAAVRPATPSDIPDLARLRWEWRAGEGRPLELDEEAFTAQFGPWLLDHWGTHMPFVAEADDAVVGIAWLSVVERVPGPDRMDRRSGLVQAVYVTPARRDDGTGGALVQALIDEAHRRALDYLAVHPSQRSFSLYRRAGFAEYAGTLELDIAATRTGPGWSEPAAR